MPPVTLRCYSVRSQSRCFFLPGLLLPLGQLIPAPREIDWKQDKSFRYNYGARRDPNFQAASSNLEVTGPSHRRPARERLSLTRENNAAAGSKESHSRQSTHTLRTEWRPAATGSQRDTSSKDARPLISHTPSPRPQREGGASVLGGSPAVRHASGEISAPSEERRSAVNRLSLTTERVPLLQDGVANVESGRLQEVDTQYLEETVPITGGTSVPSSSRNPDPFTDRLKQPFHSPTGGLSGVLALSWKDNVKLEVLFSSPNGSSGCCKGTYHFPPSTTGATPF
ncbi:hypothetical protein F2Q69_00058502 [Brassica cretica]|uniref:Uncharacterized protein n=1 Tax=Brassica cretica TaxID=69181 RepID=A0A8S9RLQ2_BRACR|nr:hypothetical protein F2Q69_00058502 [Brassica cretica]